VWLPGRLKSANPTTPNLAYGYQIRGATGTTAVSTATLHASGQYATSYQLYDGLLRERQTQVPAPGGGRVITDQIYDSRGLVARANSDYYNGDTAPSADLFTPKAAVPGQTATTYDGVGRPILATFLENGNARWQTVTSYGGDRVSVTPPKGAIATTQIADARGQLTQLLQYHGGQPTGAADVISYTYAPDGQVSTITDEAGNTWSYRYDLRGRRIEEHDPDTGTTTNTYDDDDELLTSTDGRGVTLAYSYDALGRKTGEYQDSLTGTPLARWDYDTLAKGELTDSVRYLGGQPYTTTVLGYDDRYQSLGTTLTVPATETGLAGSYTSHATYNTGADGTPLTVTYPGAGTTAGETVTFGYDTIGEATTLTGLASYVAGTTYSKIGLVSQRSSSDGAGHLVYRTNTYEDGTNRLLRVYDERSTVSGALNDTHYGYDDGGNVTSIDDAPTAAPADTQCFTYDYLQRLVTARTTGSTCDSTPAAGALGSGPAPYWQSFGYDVAGNRTSETDHAVTPGGTDATHTYTYPSPGGVQPHTVQSVTTTGGPDSDRVDSYGYDPAGDTTNRALAGDAQTLTWDAEGRLASATKDGKTSTFAYDADGTLLLRRDPGSTVLYVDGEEITVNSAGALATTRYYSFGGDTIAVRTGTGLSFLLDDRQGTASTMVSADATQAVTRRYYTPFGQARGVTPAWPGDKGYVGGIVDTAANLTIVGAREYDPDTGRFLSADPVFDIHTPQSWNAYGYANSNPTTYSDPSGLMLPCASGAGGCGKTGYVGGGKKPGYCDLHDCNPGPRVPPSVFHSGKAWNAYQRTLSARWAKVEAQIAAQKREAERRAAEVQRGRNHHHSWWDRVTSFANTVAPALTLIAVATAWVPGLDVVTAAIALTADTLSFAANGADTVVQLAHGHFARAATAAGLAGLSVVGAGGAGKLIRETRELSEARATYRTAKLAWQHAPTGITRARALISAVKVDSARQAVRQSVATDTVNWTSEFVYEVGHKVHESMEEGE
jgi:RHS repeat-associated protein